MKTKQYSTEIKTRAVELLIESQKDYPSLWAVTSAVKNGEKHLVDYVRQPDGKRGQYGIRFILYARYIY